MTSLITYPEALRVWLRVAAQSFGGPAGQIAVMHRILVEEKRWIDEQRFLHALNYCMLLPGPEAQQLATYIGWLLHGYRGGLTAGLLFILPGFLSILALSLVYVIFEGTTWVSGLFFGLSAAVLAIVAQAVLRIGKRILKSRWLLTIAALSFVAIFIFGIPFPAIVIGAALFGFAGGQLWPEHFQMASGHAAGKKNPSQPKSDAPPVAAHSAPHRGSWRRTFALLAIFAVLWGGPILWLYFAYGRGSVFFQESVFFSKAAVVTFGGAYAVLAYIGAAAVEVFGWLQPGEMLDGLAMAETTPGPLIQVVQFVGFMGAYRQPGSFDPLAAGVIGSCLTTWVTFVPCFLWIFLGAPYVERLRDRRELASALAAITAAVVGVILNLALWFALHTWFGVVEKRSVLGLELAVPVWSTVDWAALGLCIAALVASFRFRVSLAWLLSSGALLGLAAAALGLA